MRNVNVALENMESPQYLEYIFSQIQSDRIGFCFDSGHQHLYSPNLDLLSLYGHKLMAVHLHDNNQKEDMHALHFSGSINWKSISKEIKAINYTGAKTAVIVSSPWHLRKASSYALKLGIDHTIEKSKYPYEYMLGIGVIYLYTYTQMLIMHWRYK